MRVDLVLDCMAEPGATFTITDSFYPRLEYRLVDLVYTTNPPLRDRPLDAPVRLPDNTMPEPDIAGAERHDVVFGGGMMGGMTSAMMAGRRLDMRELLQGGMAWAV